MTRISAPISIGELLDKITILEIKLDRATLEDKKSNIELELSELRGLVEPSWAPVVYELKPSLSDVNLRIWNQEELIRQKHSSQTYDAEFIEFAVSIFTLNDQRAAIKRSINQRLNSHIVEEKIYTTGLLGESSC